MKTKLSIIFFIWLLALSGCAARLTEVGPGKAVVLSEREALIFGKIIFKENNEENVPYSLWSRRPFPVVFQVESEKYLVGPEVENDGSFYWIVPRGTYILSSIKYNNYSLPPQVAFRVPFEASAIYLGTLVIDVEIKKLIAFRSAKKINSITIIDEFEKTKETLRNRNQYFTAKIEKNLMIHDERIPIERNLYTQKSLLDILKAIGSQPSVQVTPSSDTLKGKQPPPQEIRLQTQPVDTMQKSQVPLVEKSQASAPVSTNTVIVTGTFANIRSGAGNNFSIVTTVKQGDKLILLGEYGEWFNVRLENGQEGWIDNRFVK
jgi:hypothetical protein